jgi:hypothetical protein
MGIDLEEIMKILSYNRRMFVFTSAMFLLMASFTAHAQLVTGLEGAQGSTIGPDGALYVTEGAAGRVSRVDPMTGEVTTFAEGLPPRLIPLGGASDIEFIDDTAYVLVSVVGFPFNEEGIDGLYRIDGPDSYTIIADIGAWSSANPPVTPFDLPNGVQYALEKYRGGLLVTDGHHNRVLWVSEYGDIVEFMTFDNIVPTGLEVHGNRVYMGQAGPSPHLPEDGLVVMFGSKSPVVTEVASGAPLIVDVEFGLGRTLYALAQGEWDGAFPGAPALPFTGSLLEINADGSMTEVAGQLNLPTSVEFIGNSAYVVTLAGEIWVIEDVSSPPFGRKR